MLSGQQDTANQAQSWILAFIPLTRDFWGHQDRKRLAHQTVTLRIALCFHRQFERQTLKNYPPSKDPRDKQPASFFRLL
jgi:hypothetical protein